MYIHADMRKEKQRVITWARIWQAMRLERHLSQHYNIINSWLPLEPNRKDEASGAYADDFRRLPREQLRRKQCSKDFLWLTALSLDACFLCVLAWWTQLHSDGYQWVAINCKIHIAGFDNEIEIFSMLPNMESCWVNALFVYSFPPR